MSDDTTINDSNHDEWWYGFIAGFLVGGSLVVVTAVVLVVSMN